MESSPYSPLYLKGIEHFNACDFFDAHEVWEELWADYQGPSRKFYQGLIQVAVALHHFGNGNIRGAKKLYGSSTQYLRAFLPHHEGIDLTAFLAQFQQCFSEVLASEEQYPEIDIDPETIPEIVLDASIDPH